MLWANNKVCDEANTCFHTKKNKQIIPIYLSISCFLYLSYRMITYCITRGDSFRPIFIFVKICKFSYFRSLFVHKHPFHCCIYNNFKLFTCGDSKVNSDFTIQSNCRTYLSSRHNKSKMFGF